MQLLYLSARFTNYKPKLERMKHLLILFFISLFGGVSFSQFVVANQGASAQTIVAGMIGSGLTVTNPVINCPNVGYGTFSGGSSTNLGINNGILLTTGNASTIAGTGSTFWSVNNLTNCNDPQLSSIEPQADNDCCILEFDVMPACSTLQIRFVFGSEEYPEFVSSGYNDAFGFFVTGPNPAGGNYTNTNVATLPNNTTIVSIDNVNANTNSSFYVNNSTGTAIKLDAFTTVLTRTITVTPCQTYHFKLAIADAGDHIYDSGVFIDFLTCTPSMQATTSSTPESCAGNDGTASINVTGGNPPYTYSWNTTPPQTTPSITGLTPGDYQVTVTDLGACNPPLIQTVTVGTSTNAPVININNPVICESGTATITANVGNGVGSFAWSTGDTTQSIVVSPTQTTSYTVTYTNGICTATGTSTATITTQFVPTFNQIPNVCQFTNAPTLPANSADAISVAGTWSPATINSLQTGTLTYTFTPNPGECAFPTTMDITVDSMITPTFNPISDFCQGDNGPLLPSSSSNIPTITGTWNPPAISTSIIGLSPYVFTPAATFCSQPITVNINVKPTPVVDVDSVLEICLGQSTTIFANVDISGGTYTWTQITDTTQSVTVQPSDMTYFAVTYSLNGCTGESDSTLVIVNPNIPVYAGPDVAICIGQSTLLDASGTPIIAWSNGVVDSTTVSPTSTTTYTVTGTSDNGCVTTDDVIVTVNPLPVINPGLPISVCARDEITLTASGAGTGATYVWDNGAVDGNPFLIATTTTFTVTGTDSNGCVNQASITITVLPRPIAGFDPNPSFGTAPLNVVFTNTSSNSIGYYWDFDNGHDTTTTNLGSVNQTFTSNVALDTFTVWLVATNGICQDSVFHLISIAQPPYVFVPNVFTPNGDNTNEVFFLDNRFLASLEVIIVNRWGNVMAIIDTPQGSWDGKTKSGADADDGVYFYKYTAVGINGDELEGQGFVTLIR